jgi:UDP-N-acetylmuramate dehydrogenase
MEEKIQKNVPLAPLTTFKIGGSAKYYIEVKTRDDLVGAVKWAKKNSQKVFYFGGGSNLLVADEGFDGLVIKLANREADIRGDRLYCGAGASLVYCLSLCRGANLSGLEWLLEFLCDYGVSVRGNAGVWAAIGDIVETVEYYNVKKDRLNF